MFSRNYIDNNYKPLCEITNQTLNGSRLNGSKLVKEDFKRNKKLYVDAIVLYKKLSMKAYLPVNSLLISNLKSDLLRLNLDDLSQKEILILSKLLAKFYYFKQVQIAPSDPTSINNLINNLYNF